MENLKPFRPGQSGNPAGRPKRKTVTERVAALLDRTSLDGLVVPEGQCVADVLAEAIVVAACRGKFAFVKEVLDRLEGKVPDRVIDETPDADADRDRAELDSLLAALRHRTTVPGREVRRSGG